MKDAEKALLVQKQQLQYLELASSDLRNAITEEQSKNDDLAENLNEAENDLQELVKLLKENPSMMKELPILEENQKENKERLIIANKPEIKPLQIRPIMVEDWSTYMKNVDEYAKEFQIDLEKDPITQLLSNKQILSINDEFNHQFGKVKWDKFDYMFVSITAIVAFIIDLILVKLPAFENKYLDKVAKNNRLTLFDVPPEKQSQLGRWLNSTVEKFLSPENNEWTKKLEKMAKTPYDAVQGVKKFEELVGSSEHLKVSGRTHRVLTPGHDPILQFIFGVLDCLKGTMSVFDANGNLVVLDNPSHHEKSLMESFLKTISHFISDLGTKQGVPAPLYTLTQAITLDTHIPFNDKGIMRPMRLNELTTRMYSLAGYNLNHFVVMGLVPAIVEIMIRTYYFMLGTNNTIPGKRDVKLQGMLTVTHTLAMSGNILKMGLNQWNPLAFNYAELLALSKSLFSTFRASTLRNKAIQDDLMKNWLEISKA